MPKLSQTSSQALDRLRSYNAPPSIYDVVPYSRRAAVLILLWADKAGDLRVVLTMRASTLSSHPGQAALPGGKAENDETAFQTARREAFEEIGLPADDKNLPHPFRIEHICELPANLSRTELVVRPCVAFLHSYDEETGASAPVDETLIPRLDAQEVAAVFSASFHNFLLDHDESPEENLPGKPKDWYKGVWIKWHETRWRMHYFHVPVTNQRVTKPSKTSHQKNTADKLAKKERYQVWGLTARILVDAATKAYDRQPEFEHNSHFGDEDLIGKLRHMGRMEDLKRSSDGFEDRDKKREPNL